MTESRKFNNPYGTHMLSPDAATLCKLGSIAVHADEARSPGGHEFDLIALDQLLHDPIIVAWIKDMTAHAMLPTKRSAK